jgi:hypothetical protein
MLVGEQQTRFQRVSLHGLHAKALRHFAELDLESACLAAPQARGDQMTEAPRVIATTRPSLSQLYENRQVILVSSCSASYKLFSFHASAEDFAP